LKQTVDRIWGLADKEILRHKDAPIMPINTASQGAKSLCIHPIWMWDAVNGGWQPPVRFFLGTRAGTGSVTSQSLAQSLLPKNAYFVRFIGLEGVFFSAKLYRDYLSNWVTQNWSRGYLKRLGSHMSSHSPLGPKNWEPH
jgi:hypothetical protein